MTFSVRIPAILALLCGPLTAAEPVDGFPKTGILPKTEIGALRFLHEHPEYDGRGIVVAIFDTGVDPGAPGLQATPDGRPKIIDVVDGTGSGDVMMGQTVTPKDGTLEGLTGRTLKVDPQWKNPQGTFRLGIKGAYELFPSALVNRMRRERKRDFELQHRRYVAKARRNLAAFEQRFPHPKGTRKTQLRELKARVSELDKLWKSDDDPGPLYDCLVFHDGKAWRAVIDTDEDGNLADEKPLTDFRAEREFATFPGESLLNFSVNIYDNGDRLSLVTASGAHGTHVAGIVGARYPKQPELNGIAPGVQIVSVKIGDSRLDSMETGEGLLRGVRAALDNRCDLINMSYGEPTSTPNRGLLVEMFTELVEQHGVIFVGSAGNAGPALSTVGAPGGTTEALLGIGAYVTPDVAKTAYTLRGDQKGQPYTWTSRGPAFDGDLGVNLFAPGGAIAPVPTWTREPAQRMNGTSMASPNACGGIALLLSGMKAEKSAYSPWSVRRSLENTAVTVPDADVFAQGAGLIQIDKAFAHLLAHNKSNAELLRFDAVLRGEKSRGIYLREPHETRERREFDVRIRPHFREKNSSRQRVKFTQRMRMEVTEDWVKVGESVLLTGGGRTIAVEVDPEELPPGAHFAQVLGYDADDRGRGPLVRLPVTVIRPVEIEEDHSWKEAGVTFAQGQIERRFFSPPVNATWAEIKLRANSADDSARTFMLHTLQSAAGKNSSANTNLNFLGIKPGTSKSVRVSVEQGRTLEVCVAQYWSSMGESDVDLEVQFHGLHPNPQDISFSVTDGGAFADVTALKTTEINPHAQLTHIQSSLTPASSKIDELPGSQNLLPGNRRLLELVLRYEFRQDNPGEVELGFPFSDGLLYDSPLASQLWTLRDGAGRTVVTDDIFPDAVKIGAGKHTVQLRLQHWDSHVLKALRTRPMTLKRRLGKTLSLSAYASRADARANRDVLGRASISSGETRAVYIAGPSLDDLPDDANIGDELLGTITYAAGDKRPGGYRLICRVDADFSEHKSSSPSATPRPTLEETIRDSQVAYLESLSEEKRLAEFEKLAAALLEQHPGHVPILVARLHRLDDASRKERLPQVVQAADEVIATVDRDELQRYFGVRHNLDTDAAAKLDRKRSAEKDRFVDALYRKGRAIGYMELPDVVAKHPIEDQKALDRSFKENYNELSRWVDPTEKKHMLLAVRNRRRNKQYGLALELLNEHSADAPPNYWHTKKRRDLYEQLGWKHAWEYERRWLVIRFPNGK